MLDFWLPRHGYAAAASAASQSARLGLVDATDDSEPALPAFMSISISAIIVRLSGRRAIAASAEPIWAGSASARSAAEMQFCSMQQGMVFPSKVMMPA
jgi:hypothetical protein